MDLEEVWGIQEAQGVDEHGRELTILVPVSDAEFGPFTGYAFVTVGEAVTPGYRMLTQEEVGSALQDREEAGR